MSRFFPGRRPRGGRGTPVLSANLKTTDTDPEDAAACITRAVIDFKSIFGGEHEEKDSELRGFSTEDIASAEELCREHRESINARKKMYLEEDYFFDVIQNTPVLTNESPGVGNRRSFQQTCSKLAKSPQRITPRRPSAEMKQTSRSSLSKSRKLVKEVPSQKVEETVDTRKRPKLSSSRGRKAASEVEESKVKCEVVEDEVKSVQESDREEEKEEKFTEGVEDEANASSSGKHGAKQIIKPSKLGGFSSPAFEASASFSTPTSTKAPSSTLGFGSFSLHEQSPIFPSLSPRLFGSTPSELIVEGKRPWKPSAKVQESSDTNKDISFSMFGSQKPVVQLMESSLSKISPVKPIDEHNIDKSSEHWDSQFRQLDKVVRSSHLSSETPQPQVASNDEEPKSPLIRQPKFELKKSHLEQTQKSSHQAQIFELVQGSLQSAHQTSPQLLVSAKSETPDSIVNSFSPWCASKKASQNHAIHERLPNGWTKKAVKRLSGDQKGRWDMSLITPDQKILKSANDLKLYIAKSGAIIDSNIVNFSLPKKTAKVDKALQKTPLLEVSQTLPNALQDDDHDYCSTNTSQDAKVSQSPLSYVETVTGNDTSTIVSEAIRALPSGASFPDLNIRAFKKTVSCKRCANCVKPDCLQCVYCRDSKKHGGKGHRKKICIERRCLSPQTPGTPGTAAVTGDFGNGRDAVVALKTYTRLALPPPVAALQLPSQLAPVSVVVANATRSPSKSRDILVVTKEMAAIPERVGSSAIVVVSEPSLDASRPPPKQSLPSLSAPVLDQLESRLSAKEEPREASRANARPPYSYAGLITLALESFPHQEATLAMIYDFIADRFPYFRSVDKNGWQNSIRHNLSLHKEFVQSNRPSLKGHYWRFALDACKEALLRKKVHKENSSSSSPSVFASPCVFTPEETTSSRSSVSSWPSASSGSTSTFAAVSGTSHVQKPTEAPKVRIEAVSAKAMPAKAAPRGSAKTLPDEAVLVPSRARSLAKKKTYRLEPLPFSQPNCGSMDFWEQYDPDDACLDGQPVLTTEALPLRSPCFLCGSVGVEELLHCAACCEPFHPYCLEPSELPQSDRTEREWVCRRCAACHVCGDAGDSGDEDDSADEGHSADHEENLQLRCAVCCHMFHVSCLQPSQRRMLKSEEGDELPWTCSGCLRCRSCGKSDVSLHLDGLPLCDTCGLQRKQGSFCPMCLECYDDNDFDTRMVECARCQSWIHAKCEGLDLEKYYIIGMLPDDIEFFCKNCRDPQSDSDTRWMKAICTLRKTALRNTLTRLMESACAKPYIRATNMCLVSQVSADSARRALQFDSDSEAPAAEAEKTEEADSARIGVAGRRGISAMQKLRREHGLRECSVRLMSIDRLLRSPRLNQGVATTSSAEAGPTECDHKCTVMLRDLRHHSWWGKKIRAEVTRSAEKPEHSDHDEVLDLTGMLRRVDEDGYANVLAFHSDFKKVCASVHVPGPSKAARRQQLMTDYAQLLRDELPWLDVARPWSLLEGESAFVAAPHPGDHAYGATAAQAQEDREEDREPKPARWKSFAGKAVPCILKADKRKCVFCCGVGDGDRQNVGRLVYYRQNEWAHVNCALWSSEVYEEVDGGMQNVPTAINRGAKLICTVCNKRGATTGCCHDNCICNFHFACGIKDGASYKEDKSVYCRQHQSLYASKPATADFAVARIVYIDLQSESRKKSKPVDLRTVNVILGALTVHSIGWIDRKAEGQFHEDAIVPVGYSCSRWFWSVKDPRKRVLYKCVTSVKTPSRRRSEAGECADSVLQGETDAMHVAIDHSVESEASAQATMKAFAAFVRRVELKRARDANASVLPPYAVSEVCSHLKLADLHSAEDEDYGKKPCLERGILASPRSFSSSRSDSAVSLPLPSKETRPFQPQDEPQNAFDAEMEAVVKSLPASPTKRLNKAVGNVMRRTPSKAAEDELEFEDINIPLEADNDLISAILRDGNFEEELERSTSSPEAVIQPPEDRLNSEFNSARVGESVTVRSWFNQNKKKKVSEVWSQCNLPFTKTNLQMDEEEEASSAAILSDVSSEADESERARSDDVSVASSRQSGAGTPVLSDIDKIMSKIIALSGGKLLELGAEERVFELGSSECAEAEETTRRPFSKPLSNADSPASSDRIMQLDGADEPEDVLPRPVRNQDRAPSAGNSQRSTVRAEESEAEADGDGSPRKDFSIAGLLSPPPPGNKDGDDDVIVVATTPRTSSLSPRSTSSPRKLLPKTAPTPAALPVTPATFPTVAAQSQNVFIHQLPTMELASSFPSSFQQATGRTLQYVGGLSNVNVPSALPSQAQYMQVPVMPLSGFIQTQQLQPQLQLTPQGFISTGYIPQQSIILQHQGHGLINLAPFAQASSHQGTLIYNHQFLTPSPGNAVAAPPTPGFLAPSSFPMTPSVTPSPFASAASASAMPSPAPGSTVSFASSPISAPVAKKIARVQPQPSSASPCRSSSQPSHSSSDPLKALSSMARQPMSSNQLVVNRLSITHHTPPTSSPSLGPPATSPTQAHKHRSVGTQARIGGPIKILTPRPWKGSSDSAPQQSSASPQAAHFVPVRPELMSGTMSSGVSAEDSSASSANEDESRPESRHEASASSTGVRGIARIAQMPSAVKAASAPAPFLQFQVETTSSTSHALEVVLGRRDQTGHGTALRVEHVAVRDASHVATAPRPEVAQRIVRRALKKGLRARDAALVAKLDGRGAVLHTDQDFVNEVSVVGDGVVAAAPVASNLPPPPSIWRPATFSEKREEARGPCVTYKLSSEDGAFSAESTDITSLWRSVLVAVQEARAELKMQPLAASALGMTGRQMLGLTHDAVAYLIEQLPGVEAAASSNYTFKHFARAAAWQYDEDSATPVQENATGCARSEPFKERAPFDMFSWLASRYRSMPLSVARAQSSVDPELQVAVAGPSTSSSSASRRTASSDLPMAMRYRQYQLDKTAKEAFGVFRSGIHGRGLYCTREIQGQEIVIEYAGEEIRASLTDMREKFYESKGIGCYMFKIDDDTVIDATMKGNAARFINHSCDPNCYSKIVDFQGKKHILILALRRIVPGEEFTYDYKFAIEDVKLPCTCSARRCRKYLN